MYRLLAFFAALFLTFLSQVSADNINLLRLDSVIAERPNITTAKEKKLAQLRSSLASTTNEEEKLALFEQMYQEYLTYRYDSALVYVQNSIILSKEIGNIAYYQQAVINYALLDARGGFYSEAADYLKGINLEELNDSLKYEYYITHFWLYMYWSQYSSNERVKEEYWRKMKENLVEAIKYEKENTINYQYLMGERMHYIDE